MNFDEKLIYKLWLPAELLNALRDVLTWESHVEEGVQLVLDGWLAD